MSGGGPVVVVTPPHLTLTKQIRVPRVEPAKLAKILRFEAEQSIPYAAHEVVWGTVVAAEHERELEVLLVAAKREAVDSLCAVVQEAGFEPGVVLPSCLATLAAFRLGRGTPQEPTLVLNLGARSSTLLHVTARRFTVRSLALGTRSLLAEAAGGQDHIAMEVCATRLAQEITRSMLHLRRQGVAENPGRLCLTGRGGRLAGLGEALAAKCQMPVDWLNLAPEIAINTAVAGNVGIGDDLILADLAGAAATQLQPGQARLNLRQPSWRDLSKRRRQIGLAAATMVTAAFAWPLGQYLRPVSAAQPMAALVPGKAAPEPAATPAAPPAADRSGEDTPLLGWELLAVRTAPFPLQLAGYFGAPGDYGVIFRRTGLPETLLARRGHRFEQLGLMLRSFEVRKVTVNHDDTWPVYEVAGFAVLLDEKTGAEVELDSRSRPADTLQAVLRGAADNQTVTRRAGELIVEQAGTYRIDRIQADPPEVVLMGTAPGASARQTHVLRLVPPTNDPAEPASEPATTGSPARL